MVNPLWKVTALMALTALVTGAPAYVMLAIDNQKVITRSEVSQEIVEQNAGLVQSVSDLRDSIVDLRQQVHDTNGKIDALSKLEGGK